MFPALCHWMNKMTGSSRLLSSKTQSVCFFLSFDGVIKVFSISSHERDCLQQPRALFANFVLVTSHLIDLVTVFDAILTSRQTREKLQCLYENLKSNNFCRTAVLKKM